MNVPAGIFTISGGGAAGGGGGGGFALAFTGALVFTGALAGAVGADGAAAAVAVGAAASGVGLLLDEDSHPAARSNTMMKCR